MESNKEELQKIINNPDLSPDIQAMGQEMLKTEFAGDEVAQKIITLQQVLSGQLLFPLHI